MAKLVPKIYPNDINENIPVGIGFPLVPGDPKKNFTTRKQIHDNLRNLILTMKGERVMQPTYGSDLYFLLFEPLEESDLADAARQSITSAVETFMPFVQIKLIQVSVDQDNNRVLIEVDYDVDGFPTPEVLNLTIEK